LGLAVVLAGGAEREGPGVREGVGRVAGCAGAAAGVAFAVAAGVVGVGGVCALAGRR